jgi:hypothetical protein|uniref:Uncharacterized protein n=1 Tax=Bionectria ochroleuca TaxID=29856 RepID=A0A8H7K1A1_BIOOC
MLQYQTLRGLRYTIEQKYAIVDHNRTATVQVPSAVMWELLSTEAEPTSYTGQDFPSCELSAATLRELETIVPPGAENEQGQSTSGGGVDEFDEPYLADLVSSSLVTDSSWLPF